MLNFNSALSANNIKNNLNFSWSSLKDFEACEGFWFVRNFAAFSEGIGTPLLRIENSFAAPGSLIQKLFEVFINNRIFLRPEMQKFEDLIEWFKFNHIRLWNLITFPVDPSHYKSFKTIKSLKNYFKFEFGALRFDKARKEGLDPQMGDIQPLILEFDIFSKIHKSTEAFHQKMYDTYAQNLQAFVDNDFDLLRMVSEIPVKGDIEGIPIKGYIDFIYDTKGNKWNSLDASEYILLDGKWKVHQYVKQEQLYLYAYLLKLTKGVMPKQLGFLDWQKSKFTYFEYDPSFESWLIPLVQRAKGRIYELLYKLTSAGDIEIPFFDYKELSFSPSQSNCGFCPVLNCCPHAKNKNVFSIDMLYGKNIQRELNSSFQAQIDSEGKSIIETTF